MIPYPQTDEYFHYYGTYIQRIEPGSDIFAILRQQPDEVRTLLARVTDVDANTRPAPGEWSIKEVMGHINDAERIFGYRVLRIARGDTTPIEGFEQNDYVTGTDFNQRTLADLIDEFEALRRANVLCFQPLTLDEIARLGTASGWTVSARAILYMMAGHVRHHVASLIEVYHVQG